jgi:hypothetical protein
MQTRPGSAGLDFADVIMRTAARSFAVRPAVSAAVGRSIRRGLCFVLAHVVLLVNKRELLMRVWG